jgi:hypothetical protein
MDQEKEKIILDKDSQIDELKQKLAEFERDKTELNIELAQTRLENQRLQEEQDATERDQGRRESMNSVLVEVKKRHDQQIAKERKEMAKLKEEM